MSLDQLSPDNQKLAKIYSMQCVVAAFLVRHLEQSSNIDAEESEIMEIAMASIKKFKIRGENEEDISDIARAVMEAFATETISASAQSARLRK